VTASNLNAIKVIARNLQRRLFAAAGRLVCYGADFLDQSRRALLLRVRSFRREIAASACSFASGKRAIKRANRQRFFLTTREYSPAPISYFISSGRRAIKFIVQ